MIQDLSWPPGKGVNSGINPEDCKLTYESIDHVMGMCQAFEAEYGEPPMLAKCDLASAFQHIIVHPSDWNKLGFIWENSFYMFLCLPFGLRSAPKTFDHFAEGLQYMAIKNGTSRWTSHYLDDTITLERGFDRTKKSIEIFKSTAREAGWEIQESKCTDPDYETEHLGIVFKTKSHQLVISQERMHEITKLLDEWLLRRVCTKRQLLSLIGKLSFVSRVIRSARTFLRRLIDLAKKVKYLHYKIKLNSSARADILWWLNSIESHNGVSYYPSPWVSSETIQLYTDASDVAAGRIYKNNWFCIPFLGDKKWCTDMSIAWRELYIVVKSLKTWGHHMVSKRVTLNVDNMVVCYCINKGSSKNPELMELIRSLYYILFEHNMECKAIYLPSADNVLADAISRFDFTRFRKNHHYANTNQSPSADFMYFGNPI